MKLWFVYCFIAAYFGLGQAYSKYGRSCKDIGCLSNEVCVLETDPCSYYQRQNECGSYPTCKKVNNAGPPSCKNYVCPPTKVCQMDGATPKCVDDHSKVGRVGYDTSEIKTPSDQPSSGNLYPNIPSGQTTERPNVGYQAPAGPGYQGGQIGSGYPGQPRPNYPQQYPQQNPQQYPQQNPQQNPYPQQGGGYNGYNGYNNGYNQQGGYRGYPQQNGQGYPTNNNNGYNNQRYPNNYQGGYSGYGQNSGSGSASSGIVDGITNALKKYGTNLLKNAIAKQIAGNNRN